MPVIIIVLLAIIAFLLVALAIITVYFYRVGIYRQPKAFLLNNPDLQQIEKSDLPPTELSWVDEQPFEAMEMKSYDGLLLRGYYLAAREPSTKIAILAHGYTGSAKLNMGIFARIYHEQLGFNVFMPDARGHGESEGDYIGFGWHERLDYVKWIQMLLHKVGEDAQILLHGISMGGGTVLMTSGESLPPQVRCAIADCAYTSAKDVLTYQLKRMYKLPAFPFIPLTSLYCKWRAGYFFGEASALKQVVHTQLPILFIHGEEDTFVPTAMVYELYEACPTYKELLLVPKAGHGVAYETAPDLYLKKMAQFIQRYIS